VKLAETAPRIPCPPFPAQGREGTFLSERSKIRTRKARIREGLNESLSEVEGEDKESLLSDTPIIQYPIAFRHGGQERVSGVCLYSTEGVQDIDH